MSPVDGLVLLVSPDVRFGTPGLSPSFPPQMYSQLFLVSSTVRGGSSFLPPPTTPLCRWETSGPEVSL